jgi:uncharacterized protein (TIGR00255 family)
MQPLPGTSLWADFRFDDNKVGQMISSMTAFAREQYRGEEGEMVWELRSVNHRFLEVFVRLPEELRGLEPLVRERVGKRLKRGKLDCTLRYRPGRAAVGEMQVNRPLVEGLVTASREIGELLGRPATPAVSELLHWPGVLEEQPRDLSPVQTRAAELLEAALSSLVETRKREGVRLAQIVQQRCEGMREHVELVRKRMPQVLVEVRERLTARLQEVAEQLDPNRLEQEMVLLAQKLDVDEEMDRLNTHLDEVERILGGGGAVGRRLDFLMQELNRETNTTTSKTNDVEVTRSAVEMKVLIEQMREQIQNLE